MRNIILKMKKIIFLCVGIIIIKSNNVYAFPGMRVYVKNGIVYREFSPALFILNSVFTLVTWVIVIYAIKYFWGKATAKLANNFNRNPRYNKDITETIRRKEKDTVEEIRLNSIKENNPDFSKVNFLNSANILAKELLYTNTEVKLEKLKDFLRGSLYNKLKRRINFINKNNKAEEYQNITILDSQILKYENKGVEIIYVGITANLIEYIRDLNTMEIISGNEKEYVNNKYVVTFVKNDDVEEKENIDKRINCPYCGAPIEINEVGKCSYCGTYIRSGKFKWRITNIKQVILK